MFYRASAPGSLILMGEYAVTQGSPCLIAAINQRIHISLIPRKDKVISIFSSLAQHTTQRDTLDDHPALRFVMSCLRQHALPSGCDIHIHADFSSQLGLGSSAATTASLCHALAQWCDLPQTVHSLWQTGMAVIQEVQGAGSGADLAASCIGGLVSFQKEPFSIEQLNHSPAITALYSGQKQSTTDALKRPMPSTTWNHRMQMLTEKAIEHAKHANWNELAECMSQAHELLCERGVCTPVLASLITTLNNCSSMQGAKISGAGYGDCVIALGSQPASQPLNLSNSACSLKRELPISITQEGVTSW